MGVVKVRLTESMLPEEKRLYTDPYADNFMIGARIMEWMGAEKILNAWNNSLPGLFPLLSGRTRWLDDLCCNAIKNYGCEQVIILGAGYDTRPLRLPELFDIPCFEVDQPELSKLKQYGCNCLNISETILGKLYYVAVDFNKDSVAKILEHPNFKTDVKSVILLEGVTQYIPISSTTRTLEHLKELVAPGSILGITYVNNAAYGNDEEIKDQICDNPEVVHKLLNAMPKNERWISGWSKDGFKKYMESASFKIIEDITSDDFEDLYYTPLGRTAKPYLRVERYASAMLV